MAKPHFAAGLGLQNYWLMLSRKTDLSQSLVDSGTEYQNLILLAVFDTGSNL